MNNLQIFISPEFGQIRIIEQNEQPWFVAKDVCEALEIKNARDALTRLEEDEKANVGLTDGSQNRKMNIVNEYGLYNLVLASRKPEAKAFKRWITHEVIPSIRKHGAYMTDDVLKQAIQSPDFLIKLATELKQEKEARQQAEANLKAAQPKMLFADAVSASDNTILIGDLAKLIKQNGHPIGQKRLFSWMRENGYLIKRQGADYNSPTQRAMEMGLFKIKETAITHADGHVSVSKTTKVTGKGQQYFINKFLGGADNGYHD